LAGIRFLDVRISDNKNKSDICVTHFFESDTLLSEVLNEIVEFLDEFPTEAIFLYLRKDKCLIQQVRLQNHLLGSGLDFCAFPQNEGLGVKMECLSGKVILICDDMLSSIDGMPPLWPQSVMKSVCDVWRCSTSKEARTKLQSYLMQRRQKIQEQPSSSGESFHGVNLDGSFPPLPPILTSPSLNQWFMKNLRQNVWESARDHIGLFIVDFVTEELCSELLGDMETKLSVN